MKHKKMEGFADKQNKITLTPRGEEQVALSCFLQL
jgi:hypothetical protein